ncbi:hypothetical protein B0H14DRAFT_3871772, partial [Mycena olivaceomarginata]
MTTTASILVLWTSFDLRLGWDSETPALGKLQSLERGGESAQLGLAAAAYTVCWALWLFAVVLVYEGVYCFARRWRAKRPRVLAIYLSAAGVCARGDDGANAHPDTHDHDRRTSSGSTYGPACAGVQQRDGSQRRRGAPPCARACLALAAQHPRGELRALRAERPTVALLLPRMGIAAVVAYWVLDRLGAQTRTDSPAQARGNATFFPRGRRADGLRARHAARERGVGGVAGRGCVWGRGSASSCSPARPAAASAARATAGRKRRTRRARRRTRMTSPRTSRSRGGGARRQPRVCAARGSFACRGHPGAHVAHGKREATDAEADMSELLVGTMPAPTLGFEGMEQVMAAIGFPSAPPPVRRGVLSGELFEE